MNATQSCAAWLLQTDMAASNEIRFKIGADTSALSAGFAKAASVAAAAGKQIEKKLGMQDAFKASAVALGLSVDKIATKVAEFFSGGSAENWKAAADAAERTAAIMDASAEKRLSLEQQIQKLKLEIESESGNTSRAQRMNAPTSVFNPFTGKMGQAQSMAEDASEADKRSAEARERIAIKEAKISALKEAQAQTYQQMVKAEEQLEELGMSSERRHKLLLEDAESLKMDRDQAIQGNKEWMPLQIAYTQKLISAGQIELQMAREKTAEMERQAEIDKKIEETKRDRQDEAEKIRRDAQTEAEVARAQLERRGRVAELQAQLNGLIREGQILSEKFGGSGPEVERNKAQQASIRSQIELTRAQALRDAQQSTFNSGMAVAGAPRALRPRGQSETERIATRGANYIQQAEEAAKKGMSASYVAKLTSLGERDIKAAGQKIQSATALVNSDSNVKSAIIESSNELKEIRKNLEIEQ